ncbi:sensor histidine kinase [Bacteroides sp. 51]|uniref:sensor histidine kinase n=1 Tax=Bacteroides sp. 51 TaxID=2302938 RepID=UPI0013D46CF3|nr:histidine kinase [Bacteroides sp. 51]NDV82385.1 hypothetical protein [Bacteroides sp. 51]
MNKIKENWKYLLFGLAGMIITFNMTFVAYQDCNNLLGNRIYLVCFSSFILFAVAILFNYYILIPRFLLKGKYLMYSVILGAVVLLLPTISIAQEYLVRNAFSLPHRITSYTSPLILIDNLASSLTFLICFLGISAIAFLRQWTEERTRVEQIQYEHLTSEINKLKGQITPTFLSRTLTHASASVRSNPKKATEMLMQLGALLRYQLYDCNREQVLLNGEISFLRNFLRVEQMNRKDFEYEIHVEGDMHRAFVPPLLFVSLIQETMDDSTVLKLYFTVVEHSLRFHFRFNGKKQPQSKDIEAIKRRLELQYPGKYVLTHQSGKVELNIDISA